MNPLLCTLTQWLGYALTIYTLLMVAYAVVSWIPGLRGRWVYLLASVIEPVLAPVRRIIPPVGGLDISFLIVLLLLQWPVRMLINSAMLNTCVPF